MKPHELAKHTYTLGDISRCLERSSDWCKALVSGGYIVPKNLKPGTGRARTFSLTDCYVAAIMHRLNKYRIAAPMSYDIACRCLTATGWGGIAKNKAGYQVSRARNNINELGKAALNRNLKQQTYAFVSLESDDSVWVAPVVGIDQVIQYLDSDRVKSALGDCEQIILHLSKILSIMDLCLHSRLWHRGEDVPRT